MGFLGITVLQTNALADAAPGHCGSDVAPMAAAHLAAVLVDHASLQLLPWLLLL